MRKEKKVDEKGEKKGGGEGESMVSFIHNVLVVLTQDWASFVSAQTEGCKMDDGNGGSYLYVISLRARRTQSLCIQSMELTTFCF